MASRLARTEAIVLRRTDYSEADRILNLLTPTGKMSAIAKGVRREKSKLAGGIELFAVSDMVIATGKSDMGTITSARLLTFYGGILSDMTRLQLGYEAIRQVSRASEDVHEVVWFDLLKIMFESLNDKAIDVRISEAWFRLQLAILLGLGLNLAIDNKGLKLQSDQTYMFQPDDMAFALHANGTYGSEHIKLLRLLSAKNPEVISRVGGIAELLDACLYVARAASTF